MPQDTTRHQRSAESSQFRGVEDAPQCAVGAEDGDGAERRVAGGQANGLDGRGGVGVCAGHYEGGDGFGSGEDCAGGLVDCWFEMGIRGGWRVLGGKRGEGGCHFVLKGEELGRGEGGEEGGDLWRGEDQHFGVGSVVNGTGSRMWCCGCEGLQL